MSLLTVFTLGAQETAQKVFDGISEQYQAIADYAADLLITKGESVQSAVVQYKRPGFLRLDFTEPNGMVMAVDGEKLQVWVPEYRVTFEQPLRRDGPALASPKGLELLERYYTPPAYAETPDPVPLDPGSSEMVIKLQMQWKSNSEGFRKIELSIDPALRMLRRIRGTTTAGETVVFDFTNIVLNRGISNSRFVYESPPTGNTVTNFLFDPEDG